LGFRVSGNVAPEAAKPSPERDDALTVTGAFPVEDRLSVCDAVPFTRTSPKSILVVLRLNVGAATTSCKAKVCDPLIALAVNVADSAEVTGETLAVKLALVAPAATVTVAGTRTNALLLARFTVNPPLGAAAFSVTVQLSVPAPIIVPLTQVRALSTGTPVPLRLTAVDDPVMELLVRVNCPVAAPAVAGSNSTLSVAV
jgi:hypothetical protein